MFVCATLYCELELEGTETCLDIDHINRVVRDENNVCNAANVFQLEKHSKNNILHFVELLQPSHILLNIFFYLGKRLLSENVA